MRVEFYFIVFFIEIIICFFAHVYLPVGKKITLKFECKSSIIFLKKSPLDDDVLSFLYTSELDFLIFSKEFYITCS